MSQYSISTQWSILLGSSSNDGITGVDLDGGGTIKGNLINIDPDPDKIEFNMPVKITYGDALGRKDKEGNSYLSYFFEPA